MTPSFPTFSIASAIKCPTLSEPEETAATCAMASFESTTVEILCNSSTAAFVANSIPRRMPRGLAPAVTFLNLRERLLVSEQLLSLYRLLQYHLF